MVKTLKEKLLPILKMSNTKLQYNPAISLLGIYAEVKTYVYS